MELKQLEIFVCVAKSLSFSKTAEQMYVSQPTVSACISALEKDLGAQLFARNTKEVALTRVGADFLPYAQSILSMRDNAMYSIKGEDRNIKGNIDIIASTIPAQHLLPEIIASFYDKWQGIKFCVEQSDSRRVEREMCTFRYDFGMVGTKPDKNRFMAYPIYEDELTLAIPPDAAINADYVRNSLQEYIGQTPFIMREKGSGTRAEIEALLNKKGVDANKLLIPAYFPDAHSILLAISRGMGISIVSKIAAASYAKSGLVRLIELDDPLFYRQISLIFNNEICLSPIQTAFVEHARSFYSSIAE